MNHAEYCKRVKAIHGNKIWPVETFKSTVKPLLHENIKGDIWKVIPSNVLKGSWQKNRKFTPEEYIQQLKDKDLFDKIWPLEDYQGASVAILHENMWGNKWKTTPARVIAGKIRTRATREKQSLSTTESYKAKLKEKYGNSIWPLEDYINSRTSILHENVWGNKWKVRPADVMSGIIKSREGSATEIRWTQDYYKQMLKDKQGDKIRVVSQYKNFSTPIKHRLKDGTIVIVEPQRALNGQFKPVRKARAWTTAEYLEKIEEIHGKNVVWPLEDYVNSATKILHENKWGDKWKVRPFQILKGSIRTNKTAGLHNATSHENYVKDLDYIYNKGTVWPLEDYANMKTKILHENKWGEKWQTTPQNVLRGFIRDSRVFKNTNALSHETYLLRLKKRYKNAVWPLEDYAGYSTKILHANKWGDTWAVAPARILSGSIKTIKTAGKHKRLTTKEYQERLDVLYDGELILKGSYRGINVPVEHYHKPTKYHWTVAPGSVMAFQGSPWHVTNGYSKIAIKWLEYMERKLRIKIQHAENGGEFKIPGTQFKVDGYHKLSNIVFEFHGDAFHGNLDVYDRFATPNPYCPEKYAVWLHYKTMKRERQLKRLGYKMISMWESDFKETILPRLRKL